MRKALAVGINAYPWLSSLSACAGDARSMTGLLERHEDHTRNFDVSELLATDADSLLDREQFRDQIIALFRDPIDIALLYFAGHGGESEGSGSLLSSNCSSPSSGLSFEELIYFANESPAHNRIVILDCCFAGHARNQRNTQGASVRSKGTAVLAAAGKQETAAEYQDGGLFTALLRGALCGGAADLLGHITPGAVYAHIDKSLGSWEQRPTFKTYTKEFTSLRNVTMQIPLAQLHRLTELFPSAQAEFALDPGYEPQPLAAHPDYPSDSGYCAIFAVLQSYCRLNLLRPVGETHMYDAAIHFRSCRFTPLGQHYWTLVKKRRI